MITYVADTVSVTSLWGDGNPDGVIMHKTQEEIT